jgi:PhnB protein
MKVNVYLNFAGNTEESMQFYRSVFGGEYSSFVRFKDMPMTGTSIPRQDENKIMHISLQINKEFILMASDILESLGQKFVPGNNVSISLHPDSKAEADRIFNALSAGGTVEIAMANQIWGDYYGSLKDKYKIRWMVNYAYPKTMTRQVVNRPTQIGSK